VINKSKSINIYDKSINRVGVVDDYEEGVYTREFFECGEFTIKINANLPNAALLAKGNIVIFGDDVRDSGIITKLTKSLVGDDSTYGKGNEYITATGYDLRYIFSRRIVRDLNSADAYYGTGPGETVIKALIASQCGASADVSRRFPNLVVAADSARGSSYTISTKYTTVYEECATAALQSGIGWFVYPDLYAKTLIVDCELGVDRSIAQNTNPQCIFDPDLESIRGYDIEDDEETFRNLVYVGGDGQGAARVIHEGYDGTEPTGYDRFEMFDNASSLSTSADLAVEAAAVLEQYAQSIIVDGDGLVLSPFMYKDDFAVGDIITIRARGYVFNLRVKSATESWDHGDYAIAYTLGKRTQTVGNQIGALQGNATNTSSTSEAGTNVSGMKNGVIAYDLSSANVTMLASECIFNVVRLTGTLTADRAMTIYLDTTRLYGRKVYTFIVEAGGGYQITVTTGISGKSTATIEASGDSRALQIYVDDTGNVSRSERRTANIDGGAAESVYGTEQVIDGGAA
jgi:hypothetical protein